MRRTSPERIGGRNWFHITSGSQTVSSTLTNMLCELTELFSERAYEPI